MPDRWEQRAISDAERVARHWPSEKHNIGVACGPSRLVVVDCDTDAHGGDLPAEWRIPGVRDGLDVLMVLAEQAGVHLPDTYTVGTPTGGTHLYFRPPSGRTIGNSTGKAGPMVDARGAGGYVLAARSVLDERAYPDRPEAAAIVKGGKTYEVLVDVDPAPLPDWLADLLDPPRKSAGYFAPIDAPSGDSAVAARLEAVVATVLDAQPGTRNNILHWATHRGAEMIAAGHLTEAQVRTCLGEAAMRIGLTPREAERTITSALCAVPLAGVA